MENKPMDDLFADAHNPLPYVKVLVSVDEAARLLSLGRTMVYRLMMRNELRSVKVGRNRRIVVSSLHEYVGRLMAKAS
jgi:excisionase family DNA binding protein